MHPSYLHYLRTRGLKEEQGFILIPHDCQHLTEESRVVGFDEDSGNTIDESYYSCTIHESPDRPHVCSAFHGQKRIGNALIYIPPGCTMRRKENE
jgi:hypothetical protein